MGSAIETLRTEAAVITGAPWSFVICVLAVAGLIWWAMSWRYGATIERLKDERDSLKTKVTDLEKQGATRTGGAPDIRQRGAAAGTVVAPSVDLPASTVHFGQLYGTVHFEPDAEFEYEGHRLRLTGWAMCSDADGRKQFTSATCQIVQPPAVWG